MASKKGMVTTCDRCGVSVFSELKGKEYFDGGYSSSDKFESLPDGWGSDTVKGKYTMLCPACRNEWHRLGEIFMRNTQEAQP